MRWPWPRAVPSCSFHVVRTLWFSKMAPTRGADGFDHMVRRTLLIAALLLPWVPSVASGQAGPPDLELRDLVAEAIERNRKSNQGE